MLSKTTQSLLGSSVLVCLLVLLLSNTGGDNKDGNYKLWDAKNQLTWADYKDTVISGSRRVALTAAGIHMSYKTSDNEAVVLVQSQMDHSKSWVDSTRKSDYMLIHEQGHFNITEYWSRKLKKDLSSAHLSMKNYKDKLAEMQKDNAAECKEMQTLYDAETKHSVAKAEQAKWDAKIEELLKKTEAFSDKSVALTLK